MRFLLAGFVLVSITFGCTIGARPNINNLGAVLNQLSQLHGVLDHLDNFFPQIHQILSSSDFSDFKDKVTQIILAGIASHEGLSGIKDKLQAMLQQKPQIYPARFNWDQMFNNLLNGVVSAIPSLIPLAISALGKRDADISDLSARNLQQLFDLVDKLNLNTLIPQIQGLLGASQIQQLQSQFFNLIANAVGGNMPANIIGQMIQTLVTQFVPTANLMRIDWEQIGQQALNGVVSALPSILIGALSLFGKRDLEQERIDYQQLLATLPVDKIAQLIQIVLNNNNGMISNILDKLRPLLQQFFPQYQGRLDFDLLATTMLNSLFGNLPSLFGNLQTQIMQLFGKRDASNLLSLVSSINIANLIPQIQQLISNIDLQQLQTQFFGLMINAVANHMDIKDLGQMIQALVTQFVPTASLMRIDWEAIGQQALNGVVTALPSILIGALSLFG